MHRPIVHHQTAVKRIYLKATIHHADWVGCPNDGKSTSGFFIFPGPNLISWSAQKHSIVSWSKHEG